MAEVNVYPTAQFTLVLSEVEARELAGALGEIYMESNGTSLPDTTVRIWQTLNSAVIDFDSRHIDGN